MDKNKQKYKYLYLLSEKYPNRQSVVTELIRLKAILNLARPTEHFMSDLHGEYESFFHILNNCSGVIKEKVDYCDCGNNEFEEIPDPPPVQVNNYPVENPEVFSPAPMLPVNIMSIVVFSLCCVFSLCFVLFFGPEPKKHSKAPVTHEKAVVKDIPTVEKAYGIRVAYDITPESMVSESETEPLP